MSLIFKIPFSSLSANSNSSTEFATEAKTTPKNAIIKINFDAFKQ